MRNPFSYSQPFPRPLTCIVICLLFLVISVPAQQQLDCVSATLSNSNTTYTMTGCMNSAVELTVACNFCDIHLIVSSIRWIKQGSRANISVVQNRFVQIVLMQSNLTTRVSSIYDNKEQYDMQAATSALMLYACANCSLTITQSSVLSCNVSCVFLYQSPGATFVLNGRAALLISAISDSVRDINENAVLFMNGINSFASPFLSILIEGEGTRLEGDFQRLFYYPSALLYLEHSPNSTVTVRNGVECIVRGIGGSTVLYMFHFRQFDDSTLVVDRPGKLVIRGNCQISFLSFFKHVENSTIVMRNVLAESQFTEGLNNGVIERNQAMYQYFLYFTSTANRTVIHFTDVFQIMSSERVAEGNKGAMLSFLVVGSADSNNTEVAHDLTIRLERVQYHARLHVQDKLYPELTVEVLGSMFLSFVSNKLSGVQILLLDSVINMTGILSKPLTNVQLTAIGPFLNVQGSAVVGFECAVLHSRSIATIVSFSNVMVSGANFIFFNANILPQSTRIRIEHSRLSLIASSTAHSTFANIVVAASSLVEDTPTLFLRNTTLSVTVTEPSAIDAQYETESEADYGTNLVGNVLLSTITAARVEVEQSVLTALAPSYQSALFANIGYSHYLPLNLLNALASDCTLELGVSVVREARSVGPAASVPAHVLASGGGALESRIALHDTQLESSGLYAYVAAAVLSQQAGGGVASRAVLRNVSAGALRRGWRKAPGARVLAAVVGGGSHDLLLDAGPRLTSAAAPQRVRFFGYRQLCDSGGLPVAYRVNVSTCPTRHASQFAFNTQPLFGRHLGDCEGAVTVLDAADTVSGVSGVDCRWAPTVTVALTETAALTPSERTGTVTLTLDTSVTGEVTPSTSLHYPARAARRRVSLAARVATAAAGSSVAVTSPAGAMGLQRALLQSRLAACGDEAPAAEEPPAPSDSPLQLRVGGAALMYTRGGALGNVALVAGVVPLVCALALLRHRLTGGRHAPAESLASLQLPGWVVVPFSLLLQPTVTFGVTLAARMGGGDGSDDDADAALDRFLVAATLGAAGALTLWMTWVVLARYHAQLVPAADLEEPEPAVKTQLPGKALSAAPPHDAAALSEDDEGGDGSALAPRGGQGRPAGRVAVTATSLLQRAHGTVRRLMGEELAFVAFARDPLFVKQYGPLFDGYVPARRWFLAVELGAAWVGGALGGVAAAAGSSGGGGVASVDCDALELLNLALNAALLCAVAALPYRSWFDTANYALVAVSTVTCSLLALLAPDAADAALDPIVSAQVYLSLILLAIPFVVICYSWVVRWRDFMIRMLKKKGRLSPLFVSWDQL